MGIHFKEAFDNLSDDEKLYAYYLSKACWAGAPIILFQTSYESPALFIMFQKFFNSFKEFKTLKKQIFELLKGKISDIEYKQFIQYASKFYSNFSNYSFYGHKKFIPELPIEQFEIILQTSSLFNDEIDFIWKCIKEIIYDDSPESNSIGFEGKGKNGYYLRDITEEQCNKIDEILRERNINPINTRLLKIKDNKFAVLIASAQQKDKEENLTDNGDIVLYYGDFSKILTKVNEYLELAKKYASNDIQRKMIDNYIESFKSGSIDKHKESQREWIKDELPTIDFNIGWIESYIDPLGIRGYFQGWVAILDEEESKKYKLVVDKAQILMDELPWGREFDKDKITSINCETLHLLCFSSVGCPEQINFPNYEDIQETQECKNIYFSNVYPSFNEDSLLFCNEEDTNALRTYGKKANTIYLMCKELFGHSSGKLLRCNNNKYNFDIENIKDPFTQEHIKKYYINNESYSNKFTTIARSMEECRSDLASLFIVFNKDIYKIFDINKQNHKDIIYSMWLIQFRKGILGLTFYNPDTHQWVHTLSQAAWVFTNYVLENQSKGEEIFKVKISNDQKNFTLNINKDMLLCYGQQLISDILLKLHLWKCTGDVENARKFLSNYSEVKKEYLILRNIILENEHPHRIELNHNLILNKTNNSVTITEYSERLEGIVESFVNRYSKEDNEDIYDEWVKYDIKNFN